MDITIDLEAEKTIKEVVLGSMENQKNGILFPTKIQVLVSNDGEFFTEVKSLNRKHVINNEPILKDFKLEFKPTKTRFVKVKISLSENIRIRNEGWLFVDEVLVK